MSEWLIASAVTALVVFAVMRSVALRQVADARAAAAAELAAARQDLKWVREDAGRQKEALESAKSLVDRAEQRLRDTFQSLAADALKDNRASFFDLAKTSFEGYRQPIADTLKRVDQRLDTAERERVEAYSRLSEQVIALGSTASTLSRALRTPAVRGRWGEMQLRRVVEISGMLHQCDFDEQPGLASDNGRFRPDLVVHLPGNKQIVVDAKTPLEAFLEAQECTDDEQRALRLQGHARQVREHMDRLGSKAYWDELPNSPEMVVMFLPGETLFGAALQQDLTLIEHGLEQRVLLASPITLIALLTTVAHSWRHEALTENYREVARLGKEFYERLATFADRFDDVRKRLDGAVQAYNEAAGSFESRVLVSARRLRDLDVTTAPELPPADPIERVPRVLKQAGLMGLPEGALTDDD
ncbi:MAG TPA: DNA recombination protein RmuC [Vicinamibacterales bacterium]|nr:DNA recombination protein RmuC [Vicinamibacterales bacterium]